MHIALAQFYSSTSTPEYARIASGLRSRGHIVWVGTPNEAGDLVWHDKEDSVAMQRGPAPVPERLRRVPVVAWTWRRFAYLTFMLRVRSFLRESQPEVVQVNPACVLWLVVLPLLMPHHVRFILDFRQVGRRDRQDPIGKLKDGLASLRRQVNARLIYDRSCFLHAAGAKITLGQRWSKLASVVPMGVDTQFLTLSSDPASPGGGARDHTVSRPSSTRFHRENPVRFLYVGRLSRVRGLELILFALQEVLPVSDEFRFVFLGPDVSEGFYREKVRELHLDSVVELRPPVPYEKVPEVTLEHDVTLAYVPDRPAHWHYHPTLKVLEYRALGMPIIATDNEPNRELVEDDVNGLLVHNTVQGLAQAMLRFVLSRDFLERCRSNAQRMRQGTTWSKVAEMYEDVYGELVRPGV